MNSQKPRVIKDFEKLDQAIQEQIKLNYPDGFYHHLISFVNKEGNKVSALPFETEEKYYLVRMTVQQAIDIIDEDDDYDDEGYLKEEIKLDFEDKYTGDDLEQEEEDEDDDGFKD
ncbi:MAG: hypothetical protein P8100_02455 [bacterium]|jgi:hypothetical protein